MLLATDVTRLAQIATLLTAPLLAAVLTAGCDKSADITFAVNGTVGIQVAEGLPSAAAAAQNPQPAAAGSSKFETNPDLAGVQLLPATSTWYQDVDKLPAHPRSREIIEATTPVVASLGRRTQNDFGPDFGMPYSVGTGFEPVPVKATVPNESEPGPHPVPLDAPIESGPDKHLLFLDRPVGKLYELFDTKRDGAGFQCGSVAVWDLKKGEDQRQLGWTSADAAGLPILPLLVRFDEFKRAMEQTSPEKRHLSHALRFTLKDTGRGFVAPARHYASLVPYSLPARPPLGMRIRVKSSLDLAQFNEPTQVLLRTLQVKGAILADNGANWFISGTADKRWEEYFEALTSNVEGKKGFKEFAGKLFDDNVEVIDFKDADVITRVD